ncbi:hypothetical protein GCM10011578_074410 [Streptomyces fuscichromogenes]|uniref:Uncharacterized protein n=1 Tax=Streptomyces fuscichromogenes TaxID=1324013 RepID=A0A917XKD5_9ACTN|nr:hypothetical protein GCM10011578_074410 [Streptomyces fuscichromogenes]
MTYAGCPGSTAAIGSAAGQPATRAAVSGSSSTSRSTGPDSGTRHPLRESVTSRAGRASSSRYAVRAAGYSGSTGT